jgi:outer membrane protein assembly factor BamB
MKNRLVVPAFHPLTMLAVCCMFVVAQAFSLDASSADALAASILSQLGRTKGFCAIPNCGNGQLARAFLQTSGMKVHAMDMDTANLRATRQLMESINAIAPTFYADKGNLSLMPYVNRFADCIVITNVTDAGLAAIPYAEIERVLAPDGLAFVGRATAEGAGLTQTALQSWINAATKSRSTATVSATSGTWAVITGRELSGVDVWPKHTYDSLNSNYSKDSVAAYPWIPQAKLKPYRQGTGYRLTGSNGGTTVTSGGRLYELATDIGPSLQQPDGTIGQQAEYTPLPPILLRAYSIYNGELLWSRDVTSDANAGLLGQLKTDPIRAYGRDVYLMRSSGILQINGITGAEIGTVGSVPAYPLSSLVSSFKNVANCGPYHASIYYTFNGTGQIGWDYRLNQAGGGHFYKPPCGIVGTIVSNGMMIEMRRTCTCGFGFYWGSHIDAPAGTFQFDQDAAADGSDRIEHGPAFGAVTVVVNPDSLDWPTHRANNSRSGRSPVRVTNTSTAPSLMWNCAPSVNYVTYVTNLTFDYRPEQEPTPPVTVGGYTFFGGSDGYIRCINNGSGRPAWAYPTGGRIHATPTVWNGCVYAGSGDGYAYCIEAHTGRLVWRFRAAPADMRMNLYGYLSSAWPILTGVLVDANGNAYFAAGMQSEYGTHVYCVNATSGVLKWQNNKTATNLNAVTRMGVTPCGYMCISRNRLIMASSMPATASFDLASGALDSTRAQWYSFMAPNCSYCQSLGSNGYGDNASVTRGREVGVINNAFYFVGGQNVFTEHTLRQSIGFNQRDISFQAINANGTPLYPEAKISLNVSIAPTWDDQNYYQVVAGDTRLRAVKYSDLAARLNADMSLPGDSFNVWGVYPNTNNIGWTDGALPAIFTNTTLHPNAMVLTPNALVATYAKTAACIPESTTWYVGALDRATGATLWETALPDAGPGLKGEPLWQGLAIDRNGYIIVAQRNGNMLCYGGGVVSVVKRPEMTESVKPIAQPAVAEPFALQEQLVASRPTMPAVNPTQATSGQPAPAVRAPIASAATLIVAEQGQVPDGAYVSANDTSDMVTTADGGRVHGLSPIQREERTRERGSPADMRWKPESPCLSVASVTASSSSGKANTARNTLDRDLRTRWTPLAAEPQWITYDLGLSRDVSAVSVVWYAAKAGRVPFAIEASTNGRRFENVDTGYFAGRGTNTTVRSFVTRQARFVRLSVQVDKANACPSIYEVGIHQAESTRSASAGAGLR